MMGSSCAIAAGPAADHAACCICWLQVAAMANEEAGRLRRDYVCAMAACLLHLRVAEAANGGTTGRLVRLAYCSSCR